MPSFSLGYVEDFIQNAGVALVVDLSTGSSLDGTPVIGFTKHPSQWPTSTDLIASNQLWLVEPVANASDTFTIRNLKTGTYVDLLDGKGGDHIPIQGRKGTGKDNQKWVIKLDPQGKYKFVILIPRYTVFHLQVTLRIQNVASKTFVDLLNGGSANGTEINGWSGDWTSTNTHQQWVFQRVSQSSEEIRHVLLRNPLFTQSIQSYQLDGEYIILPQGVWKTIWKDSGLGARALRAQIFDWDSFTVAYRTALSTWAYGQIGADNVTILAGVVFGRKLSDGTGISYNFSLSDDFGKVLFFDPQKNTFQESTEYYPVLGFF
ncbi:hypothetical protein VNI00_007306 [Paramarasmius palmivorus]|uniref:Ricin B lectin domain-containing protein n=1 Tax=Paramarasmius palmivorus TaxID=297713 RepID=A0AAW0D300_9AGAR